MLPRKVSIVAHKFFFLFVKCQILILITTLTTKSLVIVQCYFRNVELFEFRIPILQFINCIFINICDIKNVITTSLIFFLIQLNNKSHVILFFYFQDSQLFSLNTFFPLQWNKKMYIKNINFTKNFMIHINCALFFMYKVNYSFSVTILGCLIKNIIYFNLNKVLQSHTSLMTKKPGRLHTKTQNKEHITYSIVVTCN